MEPIAKYLPTNIVSLPFALYLPLLTQTLFVLKVLVLWNWMSCPIFSLQDINRKMFYLGNKVYWIMKGDILSAPEFLGPELLWGKLGVVGVKDTGRLARSRCFRAILSLRQLWPDVENTRLVIQILTFRFLSWNLMVMCSCNNVLILWILLFSAMIKE